MVLYELIANSDSIIGRLKEANLDRYDYLQRSLMTTNVAIDSSYQRTFNGYYRMGRRSSEWYESFYRLLEREKGNDAITFGEVLWEVHIETGRCEASFSSKLVATIRPDLPVYDMNVVRSLSLRPPYQSMPIRRRIPRFIDLYHDLQEQTLEMTQSDVFKKIRDSFDDTFPQYRHFTDVKKLDLFLWQNR